MPSWARWTNSANRLGIGGTDLIQLAPCQGMQSPRWVSQGSSKLTAGTTGYRNRKSFTKAVKRIPQGYLSQQNIINMDFVRSICTSAHPQSFSTQFLVRAPSSRRTITSFNSTSRLRVLVRLQRCITRCPGELPVVQRRWARLELPS